MKKNIQQIETTPKNKKTSCYCSQEQIEQLNQTMINFINIYKANTDICKMPPARGYLRIIQDANLKMLNAFDRLCQENNLEYFMVGGSVIGKIRHNGFVPWDDDIDVGMMPEDHMKMMYILKEKLPNDEFDVVFVGTWNFPKIIHKKTHLFLDIFRFDYLASDEFNRSEMEKRKTEYETAFKKEFFIDGKEPDKNIFPKDQRFKISLDDTKVEREKKWNIIFDIVKRQEHLFNAIIRHNEAASKTGGVMHFSGSSKSCEFHHNQVIFPLKRLDFYNLKLPFAHEIEDYAFTVWGDIYKFPENILERRHGKIEFDLDRYFQLKEVLKMSDDSFYNKMVGL